MSWEMIVYYNYVNANNILAESVWKTYYTRIL